MISLQNICLGLIAQEFERFYLIFTMSNNKVIKRNFEFLQREYSSELGSELFERKNLKDEYLNFLLSKHQKFLVENWIYDSPCYKSSKEYVFSRLPNLIKIFCVVTSDEILENIAKFCPKIVEIDGYSSSVTDQGVNYLCKKKNGSVPCPKLKKLFIRYSDVTENGVKKLIRNLKLLENLDHPLVPFALYSMHKKRLPNLEKAPRYNLVELKLFSEFDSLLPSSRNNDLLKICLTLCPKLKTLSCAVSDKEQLILFNNISLQELSITFMDQKINVDNFLKQCGCKLVFLDITNCMMSISKLSVCCPKLKRLIIDYVTFLDDHGDSDPVFHRLANLTLCRVETEKLSEKAVRLLLLSSPSLEDVAFVSSDLSPNMKIYILKCCEKYPLKLISFRDCINVEMNFVKDVLLSCSTLKTLEICEFRNSLADQNELIQFAETLPNKPRIDIY